MNSDDSPRTHSYSLSRHRLAGFDYSDPEHAYFVTLCSYRRATPFTDERLAREVVASLNWFRANRGVQIYAFCLMPDHLHLLLQLREASRLGAVAGAFKTWTTRQSWGFGYTGPLWQARFHDHVVRRSEDGMRVAAYILNNPVRKGLVESAGDYVWSGTPDPL